jgi:hypothetical protein
MIVVATSRKVGRFESLAWESENEIPPSFHPCKRGTTLCWAVEKATSITVLQTVPDAALKLNQAFCGSAKTATTIMACPTFHGNWRCHLILAWGNPPMNQSIRWNCGCGGKLDNSGER